MKPGFDLDMMVAKQIFRSDSVPPYSTDLNCAFEVLHKMKSLGFAFCIEQSELADKPTVHIIDPTSYNQEGFIKCLEMFERITETSDDLAHAICITALEANGLWGAGKRVMKGE